jgi:ArsR family transcriptional regulator, arsenate/arsenite/antimonite-responsive transcriptional repressor
MFVVTMNPVTRNIIVFSKALADPTRWRIVRLVLVEALCVCELADILEMPQSSVSSHVQVIRKAGLLESEKREKWTYFRIEKRYRKLIMTLQNFFDETEEPILKKDSVRSLARLAKRESSCCPGPKLLTKSRS